MLICHVSKKEIRFSLFAYSDTPIDETVNVFSKKPNVQKLSTVAHGRIYSKPSIRRLGHFRLRERSES